MPPKKKTTIVFSDEETSDIEEEEFEKGKDDAHKRERDFLEENKNLKDNALLNKYEKFAKKDKYYKKIFKKNIIRHTRLEKCINSAKIVVCVYPQTTFSNAMYSEVPTILFFNKDHYIFHDKFSKLIQQLVKNKIIFYDPRLAAIHLNAIWKNPYDWYNSYEVKKVRNLFLKDALSIVYPRNIKEEEKNWKNIFS